MSEKSDGFLCLMKARLQSYCMAVFHLPRSCCCFLCLSTSEEGRPFWQPDSDETIVTNTSYNESFESESGSKATTVTTATNAVSTAPKKGPSSPKLKAKLANDVPLTKAPRSPKSPFASPGRRNSESESEDSFSFTHSETASDQSDVEGRIRALNQELAKRKREAEQLKKEAKRRDKERLKAQEASLKKQIEAYDKYIDQVSREITREEADLKSGKTVRPQIKQPAESKKLANKKAGELPGVRTPPSGISSLSTEVPKLNRSESESSKSSVEDTVVSSKPEGTSPTSPTGEDASRKPTLSPIPDRSTLDSSLSENIYGTPTLSKYTSSSSRSNKKTSTPEQNSTLPSFGGKSPVREETSEVIDEMIDDSVNTEGSKSDALFKLDLCAKNETKQNGQVSATPRTGRSEATDYQTDTFAPDTARSHTEEEVLSEVPTEKSGRDVSSAPLFKLDLDKSENKVIDKKEDKSVTSPRTGRSEVSEIKTDTAAPDTARTETDVSKALDSARSETSRATVSTGPDSARSTKSEAETEEDDRSYSYSYSESSKSESKSKSYTEDFSTQSSSSSTSSSSRSTVTQSVSRKALEPAAVELETRQSVVEPEANVSKNEENEKVSTDTDDDISEHFSEAEITGGGISEDEDSPKLFVLDTTPTAAETNEEKMTPVPATTPVEKSHVHLEKKETPGASDRLEGTTPADPSGITSTETVVKEDANESVAEDISVATDSELERVISSAAAAVEEFSGHVGGAESSSEPTSENLSVSSDNKAAAQKEEASKPDGAQVSGKSRTMLLEMLTDDVDEETTDVEYVITPRTDEDDEEALEPEEPKSELKESSTDKKEAAVDETARDLLNESFEAIISVHRRKRSSQSSDEFFMDDEPVTKDDTKVDEPIIPVDKPSTEDGKKLTIPEGSQLLDRPEEPTPASPKQKSAIPHLEDPFKDDFFSSKSSKVNVERGSHHTSSFPSFTAESREETDDLDKLYDELGALTGDDDEWFDDDIGFGIKTPPPYSSKTDKPGSPVPSLKLELQRVAPEPFYAVPHKKDEVNKLCGNAVNVFWEKRRYGESWSDVTPPNSYYGNSDLGNDNESASRRAYKKLVFEMTGEILRDIYAEDNEDEDSTESSDVKQIGKPRAHRQKYFRGRSPPTHPDDVLPVVTEHVLGLLNLSGDRKPGVPATKKWSSRKKRDAVDEVLLTELKEEEPQWVDYQQDEHAVKVQVADSIFDNLLLETAQKVVTLVAKKRSTHSAPS